MENDIFLESERLTFLPHKEEDCEPFILLQMDSDFRRYVGGKPRTRENAERRFYSDYLPKPKDDFALWARELKKTGEYIGYCGIYPNFSETGIIENEGTLAFYLAKEHWGKKFATEVGFRFLDWTFNEKMLHKVVADIEEGNIASQRVLEKLGFQFVSREGIGRVFLNYEILQGELSS